MSEVAPGVSEGLEKSAVGTQSESLDGTSSATNLVLPEPIHRGVDLRPLGVVSREYLVREARKPRVVFLGNVRKG